MHSSWNLDFIVVVTIAVDVIVEVAIEVIMENGLDVVVRLAPKFVKETKLEFVP